jgi:hypothetical protein
MKGANGGAFAARVRLASGSNAQICAIAQGT